MKDFTNMFLSSMKKEKLKEKEVREIVGKMKPATEERDNGSSRK